MIACMVKLVNCVRAQSEVVIESGNERWPAAVWLIRAFYLGLLFVAVSTMPRWKMYRARSAIYPLWPAKWLKPVTATGKVGFPQSLTAIEAFFVVSSAAAAVFPAYRVPRVLAAVGLLEFVAIDNSYGQITHYWHGWLLTAFTFCALPNRWHKSPPGSAERHVALTALWAAQSSLLLAYSMSGVWKVGVGLLQMGMGQANTFSPTALARHIAERLFQTNSRSKLGAAIIAHPRIGWPMFVGAVYLELFSIYAAFQPRLQRLWSLGLMSFHGMVRLTMPIDFSHSMLLLAILFLKSPFQPAVRSWRAFVGALPVLGWCWKRLAFLS